MVHCSSVLSSFKFGVLAFLVKILTVSNKGCLSPNSACWLYGLGRYQPTFMRGHAGNEKKAV